MFRPEAKPRRVFQVTALRGENASAKSLRAVVQSLESDKAKLELKVKNLELQLKENKRQLSSSSGKMSTCFLPTPLLPADAGLVEGARFVGGGCASPRRRGGSVPGSPAGSRMRPHAEGRACLSPLPDLPVGLSIGRSLYKTVGDSCHPSSSRGLCRCPAGEEEMTAVTVTVTGVPPRSGPA